MRTRNLGVFYRVNVSESDVREFARRWPCFGTPRALWFEFDRRNGDLVDMSDDSGLDPSGVLALSHDAQNYATGRPTHRGC